MGHSMGRCIFGQLEIVWTPGHVNGQTPGVCRNGISATTAWSFQELQDDLFRFLLNAFK